MITFIRLPMIEGESDSETENQQTPLLRLHFLLILTLISLFNHEVDSKSVGLCKPASAEKVVLLRRRTAFCVEDKGSIYFVCNTQYAIRNTQYAKDTQ